MRRLGLDFQRPPRRSRPLLGAALLVLAVAALLGPLDTYLRLSDEAERWQAKAAAAERAAAAGGKTAQRPEGRETVREIGHANAIVRQLALPWDGLLGAVESCDCRDVALLAVDPDAAKSVVKISAEARTLEAMLDYLGHLEAQPVFGSVSLLSHHVQRQDPDRPVRFVVLARWKVRA